MEIVPALSNRASCADLRDPTDRDGDASDGDSMKRSLPPSAAPTVAFSHGVKRGLGKASCKIFSLAPGPYPLPSMMSLDFVQGSNL